MLGRTQSAAELQLVGVLAGRGLTSSEGVVDEPLLAAALRDDAARDQPEGLVAHFR